MLEPHTNHVHRCQRFKGRNEEAGLVFKKEDPLFCISPMTSPMQTRMSAVESLHTQELSYSPSTTNSHNTCFRFSLRAMQQTAGVPVA